MPKRKHFFRGEDLEEAWYRANGRRRNSRSRHGTVYVGPPQYGPSIYSNQMPFNVRDRIPVMREGGYYYTQGAMRMNLGRSRPDSRRYAVAYDPEY